MPTRRVLRTAVAAAALLTVSTATGLVSLPQASAETNVSVVDKCRVPSDTEMRVSVLILLDTSGSLRTNDPGNIRVSGTKDAVLVLDSLSGQFENASIALAIDSFHTTYRPGAGWTAAAGSSTGLLPQIDEIAAIPEGRTTTDYTQAMAGAWERFRTEDADCRLLIWFTDGEHVTRGSADVVEPEEWAELNDLCGSPTMEFLRENAWVGAVRLIADGGSGETLQYLFGETGRNCANPLQGEVYDDFDPDDLGRVLHDIIAEPTDDLIFRQDPEKMPGEQNDPPDASEFMRCTGGDGTPEQPCRIPLSLDDSIDSFRAFVDLTFLRQGVRSPDLVKIVVRSPVDENGDYRTSPTIGGNGEINPSEADGEYRLVPPFGFFTRAQYGSEIQIVGHQAAEQLADPNRWPWKWQGEWALLFYGDTPEAQADARRAAAAVRVQTSDSPEVDSFGTSADGALSGFVDHYPTDYEDIGLRLRLDANDGEPVYATRQSLTADPLAVVGDERKFELPGFLDHLVSWDSEEGGGNGRNLRQAIDERGGLTATAVLNQKFKYGGHPDPLEWERDIGGYRLADVEVQTLRNKLDGRDRVGEMAALLSDAGIVWLPSEVTLGEPLVLGDTVSIPVTAAPGTLAGVLTLDEASVSVLDAATATPETAGEARWPADPLMETQPWSCEVPSAASHASDEFSCPTALPLRLVVEYDTELGAGLTMEVAEQQGEADRLMEGLWFPSGSPEEERLGALLGDAVTQARYAVSLESGRFNVLGPPPPEPPPPPPPPVGDRLRESWPMLAILVAVAAAGRVFMAWRLRPWAPVDSAEYAVLPLRGDGLEATSDLAEERREVCMDLRRPRNSTRIDGLSLRSRWLPLLLGRAPELRADSPDGHCVGPAGCRRPRRFGPCRAIIGPDLVRGWVVHVTSDQTRLIVWGLPLEPDEARDRIADATRDAVQRLEQHHEEHPYYRAAPSNATGDRTDESAPSRPTEPPTDELDPFAAGEDAEAAEALNDDPFGRDSKE